MILTKWGRCVNRKMLGEELKRWGYHPRRDELFPDLRSTLARPSKTCHELVILENTSWQIGDLHILL